MTRTAWVLLGITVVLAGSALLLTGCTDDHYIVVPETATPCDTLTTDTPYDDDSDSDSGLEDGE